MTKLIHSNRNKTAADSAGGKLARKKHKSPEFKPQYAKKKKKRKKENLLIHNKRANNPIKK
jgi:hypothetical protein